MSHNKNFSRDKKTVFEEGQEPSVKCTGCGCEIHFRTQESTTGHILCRQCKKQVDDCLNESEDLESTLVRAANSSDFENGQRRNNYRRGFNSVFLTEDET